MTGCAGHKMLSLYHLVPRFRFLSVLFVLINFCIFNVTNRVEIRFGLNLDPFTNPLRFMIYIAIGHAFDAVEGSLLENYGLDTQDGTKHCHAVFMEHASMVGETAYLVTYEK